MTDDGNLFYAVALHPGTGRWGVACQITEDGQFGVMTPKAARKFAKGCAKAAPKRPGYDALPQCDKDEMTRIWTEIEQFADEADEMNRKERALKGGGK